ncbi:SHOCT domain-containing protein [Streptomyces himalayensis]|uniref:SHOCT domain-containing protein n=1 Tax=Streptomyces himalayensis subsp. himalayensis TaxID=2756131 RepID=A0A7W0IB07_9ACTN|nr:SHOCT domain-containing protein [Streptomyces himalayensis]MBA2948903.1 SHOCT domain-containing protein [Streptomyces himalayensis subsp. himalayensis]
MMFWFDHGVGGWGWLAMSITMILFWALIITAAVLLFRALGRQREHTHTPAGPAPEQTLAERFARGEIDEEEYRRRLAVLRDAGPASRP